jgi:hypothetical protein
MSARTDGAEGFTTTTSLPSTRNFTKMAWVQLVVDTNAFQNFFEIHSGSGQYYYCGTTATGTLFGIFNVSSFVTGTDLTVGRWYHVAMSNSGTGAGTFLGYLNGVLECTHAGVVGVAETATGMQIAHTNDGIGSNIRIAAYKCWSAVLSPQEIRREMKQFVPVRKQNLNRFLPLRLHSDVHDYAPGVANWTAVGTMVTEPNPPIPWQIVRRSPAKAPAAGGGGRTTRNTRAWPLGVEVGMNWRLPC